MFEAVVHGSRRAAYEDSFGALQSDDFIDHRPRGAQRIVLLESIVEVGWLYHGTHRVVEYDACLLKFQKNCKSLNPTYNWMAFVEIEPFRFIWCCRKDLYLAALKGKTTSVRVDLFNSSLISSKTFSLFFGQVSIRLGKDSGQLKISV